MDAERWEVAVNAQTAKCKSFVTVAVALAIVLFAASSTIAKETPKGAPTAKQEKEEAPTPKPEPKPISLDDYLDGILKPGTTPDDQMAFAKKHSGANVTWTGYVRTVNKNLSPDGAFYQLILQSNVPEEGGFPRALFVAQMSGADEKKLLALGKDQKVTVSGILQPENNPVLPTLAKAKLSGS